MKYTTNYFQGLYRKLIPVIICLIIGSLIFTLNKKVEHYYDNSSSSKITILQSSPYNFTTWINSNTNCTIKSFDVNKWRDIIDTVSKKTTSDIIFNTNKTLLLVDPLDKDTYFPNIPEETSLTNSVPFGYFISIVSDKQINKIDCSYNFENKVVGYIDRCDYNFIQAIIQSYRMNPSLIKLIQVQSDDIKNIVSLFNLQSIDIVITYYIPNSLVDKYLQTQNVNILGFSTLDFNRVKLFYPYITPQNISLKALFTSSPSSLIQINKNNNNTILPKMTMKLLNIYTQNTGVNTPSTIERFITRLTIDQKSLEANYRCYGDLTVESKVQCDSLNDIYGRTKLKINEWDKPCNTNEECPFYKKNTKYPNKRGGCLESGSCEMPIGVLQTAPHIYADSGRFQPFCYGCSPGNDPDCCNKTHDYAFVNDTSDRVASGLKTSIPLM
jgi:hypothetical protein